MKFKNDFLNKKLNYLRYLLKPHRIEPHEDKSDIEDPLEITLPEKIKDFFQDSKVGLVKDTDTKPYYTKFARFLENNDFNFEYYNIFSSNWQKEAQKYDYIIWRPMSYYWEIDTARNKIYFLEKMLNIKTVPSFKEIKFYENKTMQYYFLKQNNYPLINTFISNDYDEVMEYIENTEYPLVSKIKTSSGSSDVTLVKNKHHAKKIVKKIFKVGRNTYWPFLKQKNYVILQDFLENHGFDVRVIILDKEHIFGYYREPNKGDFRASGTGGLALKREFPVEIAKIALQILNDLDFNIIAVDFLKSKKDNNYYISELSYFTDIVTCTQAKKNQIPGKYILNNQDNRLDFQEGKYWLQELLLKKFFTRIYQNSDMKN